MAVAREDDWYFEADDFKIPVEVRMGRQFLHDERPTIIFQGKLTPFQNANTEKTSPPELVLRISKDKVIELANKIREEWE